MLRIIPSTTGFTYVIFNEGQTVPIAYKSHLYSNAELRFTQVEKILTAGQMSIIKERGLVLGQRIIVVAPVPSLEAATRASTPNARALNLRWLQWSASLNATDVQFVYDATLCTQEFLSYAEYPGAETQTLPIDAYEQIFITTAVLNLRLGPNSRIL